MQVVGAAGERRGGDADQPVRDVSGSTYSGVEGVAQVGQPALEPGLEDLAAQRRQAAQDSVERLRRVSMATGGRSAAGRP